jgi:hypothetical protein
VYITELSPFSISIFSKSEKEFFIFINMDYDIVWNFKKYKNAGWRQSIVRTSCDFANIDTVHKYTGDDTYMYSDQWWSLLHFNKKELGNFDSKTKHALDEALTRIMSTDKIIGIHSNSWDTSIDIKEKFDEEVFLYDQKRNALFK